MHASGEPAAAPHSASSTSLPPSNGTRPNQDADGGGEGDERELPVVLQDLVPLSYLIDRVVSSAYSDLATLVETLPGSHAASTGAAGTDDQARKRKIVDHVLNSRRQLVKLLVLARWSKEAHRLHKAINIVGFLAIQNHQIDRAIEALTETHGMLARARVRNYDLASALNVLSTGSAASLPASLTDPFAAELAHPLTDAQVLDTLAELDRVLLARLVLRIEPLPPALTDPAAWRIHDGRVTFRVDGMWEADLTFGGDNESEESTGQQGGEWYLLAIRFLFRVKNARGGALTAIVPIQGAMGTDQTLCLGARVYSLVVDSTWSDQGPLAPTLQPRTPPPTLLSPASPTSTDIRIRSKQQLRDDWRRRTRNEHDRRGAAVARSASSSPRTGRDARPVPERGLVCGAERSDHGRGGEPERARAGQARVGREGARVAA